MSNTDRRAEQQRDLVAAQREHLREWWGEKRREADVEQQESQRKKAAEFAGASSSIPSEARRGSDGPREDGTTVTGPAEVESNRSLQVQKQYVRRLQLRWYIAIFIAISLSSGLVLESFLPEGFFGAAMLAIGFTLTYGIHQKVEHGHSDISGGASIVLALVIGLSLGNAPLVLLYVLWAGPQVGWHAVWQELLITYVVIVAFVIALTTALSWATNMGPIDVLKDSFRRIGTLD